MLLALTVATARELLWGLRAVSSEVEYWRALAANIPDEELRDDALGALARKRGNIDGAALFWTLPKARNHNLLRLLVAYETLADYLDCTSERGAHIGIHNGLQLHRALIEALDDQIPLTDYYRFHPWRNDGGYINALVHACREAVGGLPSYEAAGPLAIRAASLAQVLALNHEPEALQRDEALKTWAAKHAPDQDELLWFEWSGAASAWLTVLALLASAATPGRTQEDAFAIYGAYLPWVSLAGTMLDSYGDIAEDASSAAHSYIAHYPSAKAGAERLKHIVTQAIAEVAGLPDGPRHVVITSCMVAMYLSKDSVRTLDNRLVTSQLACAAGPLTRSLIPVLRAWRLLYGQRAS